MYENLVSSRCISSSCKKYLGHLLAELEAIVWSRSLGPLRPGGSTKRLAVCLQSVQVGERMNLTFEEMRELSVLL